MLLPLHVGLGQGNVKAIYMEQAKTKLTEYVKAYKELFATEYFNFVKGQKLKVKERSNKWAEINDTNNSILIRKYGEMPATLYAIIETRLTPEEFTWFRSIKGHQWFYRTFSEFRETEKV